MSLSGVEKKNYSDVIQRFILLRNNCLITFEKCAHKTEKN